MVGDASLMPLLATHHVVIDVAEPSPPWFSILLTTGLPIALMLLLVVWMAGRPRSHAGLLGFARSKARRDMKDRPKVTFGDVASVDDAEADFAEVVDFLRDPHKYLALGARIPRGVLPVGPPGTGKTLLARASRAKPTYRSSSSAALSSSRCCVHRGGRS